MFSATISTSPGDATRVTVTDAEDHYLYDVALLLSQVDDLRRCEIDALEQHRLFGECEEVG